MCINCGKCLPELWTQSKQLGGRAVELRLMISGRAKSKSGAGAWAVAEAKVISAAGCINPAMNNLVVRSELFVETFKPQELRRGAQPHFDHPSFSGGGGGGALAANSSHECPVPALTMSHHRNSPYPSPMYPPTSLVGRLLCPAATTLNRVWMAWRTAVTMVHSGTKAYKALVIINWLISLSWD